MNYNFIQAKLNDVVVHKVGNKFANENCIFGKKTHIADEKLKNILTQLFLSSFKSENFYHFDNEVDLLHNLVFSCVSKIFENPAHLYDQSINLAKYLYSCSNHPNIKSGEFFVCYFKDCSLEDEALDAVGIFKTEVKDIFLEVEQKKDEVLIYEKHGINLEKLDKGCIIFNKNKENGFVLKVIDNVNKNNNARYWKDEFLSVSILKDDFFKTKYLIEFTKKFVKSDDFLKEEVNLGELKDVEILKNSCEYFQSNESFNMDNFQVEVLKDDRIINSFKKFEENKEVDFFSEDFKISNVVVDKKIKSFNKIIKLDGNFKVYIQGGVENIEKSIDDNGRKYYKLYYDLES